MEHGSIEREIHIDASPGVVFEVITSPEHIREWWNGCETDVAPSVGAVAELAWGKGRPRAAPRGDDRRRRPSRPGCFSFRWVYGGQVPATRATRCSSPSSSSRRAAGPRCG